MVAYLAVGGFAVFLAAACATTAAGQASGGVRGALVAGLCPPRERLHALATLRVYNHVGTAVGAVLGGAVIALNTRGASASLIVFDAATYAAYAVVVTTVPRVAGVPRQKLAVLRDAPYMTLAAMVGVLSLSWGMLSSGVPLWIVRHTRSAPALGAAIVVVNAVGIAAFQVRVTRGIETPLTAARAAVISGALPAGAAGSYQGMFATGEATAQMAAPALMTTLIAGWGTPGWFVLAAIFVLAGAPAVGVTQCALQTRAAGHYTS